MRRLAAAGLGTVAFIGWLAVAHACPTCKESLVDFPQAQQVRQTARAQTRFPRGIASASVPQQDRGEESGQPFVGSVEPAKFALQSVAKALERVTRRHG